MKKVNRVNLLDPISNKNQVGFGYKVSEDTWRVKTITGIHRVFEDKVSEVFRSKNDVGFINFN